MLCALYSIVYTHFYKCIVYTHSFDPYNSFMQQVLHYMLYMRKFTCKGKVK